MLNLLFPRGSKSREKLRYWYYFRHVPKKLSRNYIHFDSEKGAGDSTINSENTKPSSQESDILAIRFKDHRSKTIPWLDSVKPLKGLRILEIGCGNGTSTVALAEQGAIVTAIDIEPGLLHDAEERCRKFGVNVRFYLMNATDVPKSFSGEQFDMILFFAVLEHMTYSERLSAIRATYTMLQPGGLWCVAGTPNRLHYYDSHTAMMPFFYWLPDELAIRYASFSTRQEFGSRFENEPDPTDERKLEFARWGRGMSYHEFEISLGPLSTLNIVSSLSGFMNKRDILYKLTTRLSSNGKYKALLSKLYPAIPNCLFDPFLYLIIQK